MPILAFSIKASIYAARQYQKYFFCRLRPIIKVKYSSAVNNSKKGVSVKMTLSIHAKLGANRKQAPTRPHHFGAKSRMVR